MTSEIRANTLKNRVGLGTVSFTNTGPIVSGIITATNVNVGNDKVRIANTNFSAAGNADELILGDTSGNRGLTIVSGNTGIGALFFADDGQNNIGSLVYEHNTNQMRMNVNGSQVMRLDYTSVPTWIYGSDTNTFTSLPAADTIAFTTGGSERLRINSSGQVLIGTTSGNNANKIHARLANGSIANTSNQSVILAENSSNTWITIGSGSSSYGGILFADNGSSDIGQVRYNHSTNALEFLTNGGNSANIRLRIASDGKLGVGDFSSTSISQALHVRGSQPSIYLEHTGGYDMTLTTNDGMGQNGITVNGGFLSLAYNNKNIVMCRTGGRVGIGTDNPASPLQVVSSANNIVQIRSTTRYSTMYIFDSIGSTFIQCDSGNLRFGTGGGANASGGETERLRILTSGEVSIGGFTPTAGAGILQINGGLRVAGSGSASDTTTPYIYRTSGVDNLNFATSGVERLRIDSNGKLGIGMNSDQQTNGLKGKLDIDASGIDAAGDTDDPSDYAIVIRNPSSTNQGNGIAFTNDSGQHVGGAIIHIDKGSNNLGDLAFYTAATSSTPEERLRIKSDGIIGVNNTEPEGKGIDVAHSRTNGYTTNTDTRNLAHIIARNSSDGAGRFAALSFINGGGTQAEGSINLVQTGNYTGDLTFKLRTSVSGWQERLRIISDGRVQIGANNSAFGQLCLNIPSQAGGAALQVMNTNAGSGDNTLTNIVLRSVNNSGSNWAHAEYRASSHIFAYQGTQKFTVNSNGAGVSGFITASYFKSSGPGGGQGIRLEGLAAGSGSNAVDTGISVNQGNASATMLVIGSRNTSDQQHVQGYAWLLRFAYNGDHLPAVHNITGNSAFWSISKSGSNTLQINGNSGNWQFGGIWVT